MAATTKPAQATAARKPRADKGKKHTPGAGRPAGTAKGRKIDPELAARMARIDALLKNNAGLIKASGIAVSAKVSGPDLQRMREGLKSLTESSVSAVEAASVRFVKEAAKALGYNLTKK